jgi:SAM-dependent methyltransferase
VPIDPRAQAGFGADAATYERVRPTFPADAVARVARELKVDGTSTVLDLGAGTGKLTRLLVPLAGRVITVEPVDAMRSVLQELLPGVEALEGTAEAIPLADGSVDAVFVGEAFHWFRAAEAAAEIARVLTPGGGLAVLWSPPGWIKRDEGWLPELRELLDRHRGTTGGFPMGEDEWESLKRGEGQFEPFSSAEVAHVQHLSIDDFTALIGSWSWIAILPDPDRAEVLRRVRALVAGQTEVELRYVATLNWARKRR